MSPGPNVGATGGTSSNQVRRGFLGLICVRFAIIVFELELEGSDASDDQPLFYFFHLPHLCELEVFKQVCGAFAMQRKAWQSMPCDAFDCTHKHGVRGPGLGRELPQATISQYLPQVTAKG